MQRYRIYSAKTGWPGEEKRQWFVLRTHEGPCYHPYCKRLMFTVSAWRKAMDIADVMIRRDVLENM